MLLTYTTHAQEPLTNIEYFFDGNDLGFGNNPNLPITQNFDGSTIELSMAQTVATVGLANGFHRLSVRVRNNAGIWSHNETSLFVMQQITLQQAFPIVAGEYFFDDNDLGIGNNSSVSISQSGFALDFIDERLIESLPIGFHKITYRFKSQQGAWSHNESALFFVAENNSGESLPVAITKGEYFFDKGDRGHGKNLPVDLSSVGNSTLLNFTSNFSIDGLGEGFHNITFRFQNEDGVWSHDEQGIFFIVNTAGNNTQIPSKITKGEYFLDGNDLGLGQNEPVTAGFVDGQVVLNFLTDVAIDNLTPGIHNITYRFQNEERQWTHNETAEFTVSASEYPIRPGAGYALGFSGNDFVQSDPVAFTNALTIETWANWSGAALGTLISDYNDTLGYELRVTSDGTLQVLTNTGRITSSTPGKILPNQWTHIAFTYENDTVTLYVNGLSVGSDTGNTITQTNNSLFIGRSQSGGNFFQGKLDEVRIWDHSLSPDEIRSGMTKKLNENHPNYTTHLKKYYRFDEGEGAILTDLITIAGATITGADWQISGAALGDENTFGYGVTTLNFGHPSGDNFATVLTSGTMAGIHIYRVDQAPNVIELPVGFGGLSFFRYYGYFIVNPENSQVDITYNYNGNPFVNSQNTDILNLATRENNATTLWGDSQALLDNSNQRLLTDNSTPHAEYILGEGVTIGIQEGDLSDDPIIITSLPFTDTRNLTLYNDDFNGASNQASADIFYRFTVPLCTDVLTISLCNSAFNTYMHVLDQAGNEVLFDDDGCTGSDRSLIATNALIGGNNYTLVIEGAGTSTGEIDLEIKALPLVEELITETQVCQPGQASIVVDAGSVGTDSNYSWSTGENAKQITVTQNGIYKVTFASGNCVVQDEVTVILNDTAATLTGPDLARLNENITLTYGDDFGVLTWEMSEDNLNWEPLSESSNELNISFNQEGIRYFRVQQDFFGCSTAISNILTVEISELRGDNFDTPFELDLTTAPLQITSANAEYSNQLGTAAGGQSSPDVFYRFSTSICTETISIETCGSDFNTILYVFDANRTLLASNDDACDDDAQLKITVLPETTYFIVAEGFGTATGTINLSIETTDFILELGDDVGLCEGQEIILDSGVIDPNVTFLWSPGGETTPQITVNQIGEYTLEVDRGGCVRTDTVQVNLTPELVVGSVNNVIPANGATELTLPITLFWSPTINAASYDLFVWEDGMTKPDQPFAVGVSSNGFVIEDQLDLGKTYTWQVTASNACQTISNEGPAWNFSLVDLPDLIITQITMDPDRLFAGEEVAIEWSYDNIGLKTTGQITATSEVYLSIDDSLNVADDILIGTTVVDTLVLNPGESTLQNDAFVVPNAVLSGEYFVFMNFTTNGSEGNIENNNAISDDLLIIETVPIADIVVNNISYSSDALSGQIIDVGYQIENIGTAKINKIFSDRIYISDSPVFNISEATLLATQENVEIITEQNGVILDPPLETFELLPGEVTDISLSFNLPENIQGDFFLHIRTDSFNQVFEANETNNNDAGGVITVSLAPVPDLVALSVSSPSLSEAGTLVDVSWSVENQGTGAPFVNSWIDALYLSSSPNCADVSSCGTLVGQFAHFEDPNNPLVSGNTYQGQSQVFLPSNLEGDFFFYLVTNVTGAVSEPSGNNTLISPQAISISSATNPSPGPCGDNFINACAIDIPNENYGYGLIPFNNLDLTNATIEPGEQFSTGIPGQKSLWYKFQIPTSRYVKINVEERDNQLHLGKTQVGVSVFVQPKIAGLPKVTLPDGTSDLSSFVQLNQFGNTFEKCLKEGVYYVRFSADNYLDDIPLNATIEIRSPEEFVALPSNILKAMQHDQPRDAHVFPVPIGHRWRDVVFETGCLSIDSKDEVMPLLGTNFQEYDQSAWFVFKTDDYNDALRIQLNALSDFKDINKVGFRLYQGDARTTTLSNLQLEEEAIFERITRSSFRVDVPFLDSVCNVANDTFYSIQLFFYKNYENRFILSIHDLGMAPTQGTDPANPVVMGMLPKSDTPPVLDDLGGIQVPGGERTAINNYFACNAYMINQPACQVLPATGSYTFGNEEFDLNQWYSFSFDEDVNLWINSNGPGSKYLRLYSGDVQQACTSGERINLVRESSGRFGAFRGVCVSAGNYSLQVLGTSYEDDVLNPKSNLGRENDLEFYVMQLQQTHQFDLSAANRIEKINFDATTASWTSLVDGQEYASTPDIMGCAATVLPAGPLCSDNNAIQGAIYRTINIDRPGELFISSTSPFRHRFYLGDAAALATGFTPTDEIIFEGDLTSGNCFTTLFSGTSNFCVTPGIYTLVSLGINSNVGSVSAPVFTFFEQPAGAPQFTDPATPEDLGDITAALIAGETISSSETRITCESNPLTIDGEAPCRPRYDKLFFRQFFLSSPQLIQITGSDHSSVTTGPSIRLYNGKVSDGIETLKRHDPKFSNDRSNGCKARGSNRTPQWTSNLDICDPQPLPAGWYTVVYYASGGSYDGMTDAYYIRSAARYNNSINIKLVSPRSTLESIHNRPYLASDEGELFWERDPETSGAYPLYTKNYRFTETTLNECIEDAPFVTEFQDFPTGYNRVTYYTFKIKHNSFARFSGYDKGEIYPFDVRKDSISLKIGNPQRIEPLSPCSNGHEYCSLQPGDYTLVVYSKDGDRKVTPSAYIDRVLESRYDFAKNAYDMGEINGDGRSQFMNMDDLYSPHPTYPGRAWTNDFFSCETGAASGDPRWTNELDPPLDYCHSVASVDENHYPLRPNKDHNTLRKNLWYSFVVDGPGMVSVSVFNMTKGKGGFNPYSPDLQELIENFNPFEFDQVFNALFPGPSFQYPFAIYTDEDVSGDLSYEQLMTMSAVDTTTTLESGFIGNNAVIGGLIPRCLNSDRTVSWNIDPCPIKRKRRYYVVVENYGFMLPNSQLEVAVNFRSVEATPSENDRIVNAFNINNTQDPFVTEVLEEGTYDGATSSFTCATRDEYDQNDCGQTTIWYRFESNVSGKIRMNYTIDTLTTRANPKEITLYKELESGKPEGLLTIPLATVSGNKEVEGCLNRGVYYFTLTGCFPTALSVTPSISLIPEAGDICDNPAIAAVDVKNQRIDIPLDISCHSWGGDFGEDDFTNTACIFEDGSVSGLPLEFKDPLKVKSSWFKFSVGDIGKSNLTFEFAGFNSTGGQFVGLSDLAFRVFTGSCGSMTSIGCSSKQTTGFTLDCMPPNTAYYVQVTAPSFANGIVTMSVTAANPSDPTCIPPEFDKVIAEFDTDNQCQGLDICFANLSTQGQDITYEWDFGDGSAVSNELTPCHIYPESTQPVPYEVRLKVRNEVLDKEETVVKTIVTYPSVTPSITYASPVDVTKTVQVGTPMDFIAMVDPAIDLSSVVFEWNFGNDKLFVDQNDPSVILNNLQNPRGIIYEASDVGEQVISLSTFSQGCKTTVTDTITVVTTFDLNVTAIVNAASCFGETDGSIDITVSGGQMPYQFDWGFSTEEDLDNLVAGTYGIVVTDASGTTIEETFIVEQPDRIAVISLITPVSCSGGSDGAIDITISGGTAPYILDWGISQEEDLANLAEGDYTLLITDSTGCTFTDTYTIESSGDLLAVTIMYGSPVDVTKTVEVGTPMDFMAVIDPSIDVSLVVFEWNFGNDKIYLDENDPSIILNNLQNPSGIVYETSDIGEQIISLSVFSQGCNTVITDTLTVIPVADLNVTAIVNAVSCFGEADGSIDITVTGGTMPYQFDWGLSNEEDLNNLVAGTYTIVVTDALGTTIEQAFTIDQPEELVVTSLITPVSCSGDNDGAIDVTILGGTTPYTVDWGISQEEDLVDLAEGDYTLSITDSLGCIYTDTYTIEFSGNPLAVTIETEDISCAQDCLGVARLIISGGVEPYSVIWDDGSIGIERIDLCEGNYSFTITDADNCTLDDQVSIGSEDLPVVTLPAEIHACEGSTALLDAGNQGKYYLWSTGEETQQISVSTPGVYGVQVTNSNNTVCGEAVTVIAFNQGTRIDGKPVLVERSNPDEALGEPDALDYDIDYVSLGFGGSITLQFDLPILDIEGNDFKVFETSTGNPTFEEFPEEADVYASADGIDFKLLGRARVDHFPQDNQFDLATIGLDGVNYIKIVDKSDTNSPLFGGHHDGFDLDGIKVINCLGEPGCTVAATTEVFFHEPPKPILPAISMICPGEELTLDAGRDGFDYFWSTGETTRTIKVNSAGIYTVEISEPFGCGTLNSSITVATDVDCSGPKFVSGQLLVDNTWQTATLPRTYQSPIIVATPVYAKNNIPAVTRIRNVNGNQFEIKLQNPLEDPLEQTTVHYIVVEEGAYLEAVHGITMEAGKIISTRTDRTNSWKAKKTQLVNDYLDLVALGQVMSVNDRDWSVFWSRGPNVNTPPVDNDLRIGKHVGQDKDISRNDETVGYICLEAGQYNWENLVMTTDRGEKSIQGIENNPPYNYNLTWNVSNVNVHTAVASITGMADNDGGWPVIYDQGLSSSTIGLAIEEDRIKDNEREHIAEMVAYMVLGTSIETTNVPFNEVRSIARDGFKIRIYPTPSTTGILSVELAMSSNKKASGVPAAVIPAGGIDLKVFGALGTQIFQKKYDAFRTYKIDLSNQPSGYYFLKVTVGKKISYHKVLIHNK